MSTIRCLSPNVTNFAFTNNPRARVHAFLQVFIYTPPKPKREKPLASFGSSFAILTWQISKPCREAIGAFCWQVMCCRGGCLVFRAKAQNQLKAQQAYEERKAEKRLQCRQVRRKETAVQTS
ncbi:hypothetical protein GPALN_010194 [Globodera pallida]|nr:hypothetical protein GPALN_010194 [Globodera pallida]